MFSFIKGMWVFFYINLFKIINRENHLVFLSETVLCGRRNSSQSEAVSTDKSRPYGRDIHKVEKAEGNKERKTPQANRCR